MNLKKYFESKKGSGSLATSSKAGKVDIAVYSKPHVMGKDKVAFVMKNRLSRKNLKSNPKAAYMFKLDGKSSGIRLYLKMVGEETDQKVVLSMRRRSKPLPKGEKLFLAYFKVTKARALVGDKEFVLN